MDAVITYVDGLDPVWRKSYEETTSIPILDKRFRDWGTLKYLLRGIETFMPFIRNVFLVVASPSQVPAWVNKEKLRIVLHQDFIPKEHLPTFNCNPLEMYLHRIPGLDERFLYFNDDMFPVAPCTENDFFQHNQIHIGFYKCFWHHSMYKQICRNSDRLAKETAGVKPSCRFIRPQHTCSPMFKSVNEHMFSQKEKEILASLSTIRNGQNLNQYLYLDYLYYTGRASGQKISNKHYSLALGNMKGIAAFLQNPTHKIVCINDVHLSPEKFETYRQALTTAFETRFPQKSSFEL